VRSDADAFKGAQDLSGHAMRAWPRKLVGTVAVVVAGLVAASLLAAAPAPAAGAGGAAAGTRQEV
jgi:hypothetical protein